MGIVIKPKSFQKEELNLNYFNAKPLLTLDTPKVKEPLLFNFNDNKNLNPLTQPNSNLYLQNPENIKNDSLSMRLFPNVIYISFFVLNLSFSMPHYINGITYSRSYNLVKNVIIKIYEILPNTRL